MQNFISGESFIQQDYQYIPASLALAEESMLVGKCQFPRYKRLVPPNMFNHSSNVLADRSEAVLLFWILFVIYIL